MIYLVELEKTMRAQIYVEADSTDEANEAATELVEQGDWEELDLFSSSSIVESSGGQRIWSGGEDGEWA